MLSQRMELQSRIIKDQVFGSQHQLPQDNRADDADSATIYDGKEKGRMDQLLKSEQQNTKFYKVIDSDEVNKMALDDPAGRSSKTSTSSDMMMDMSECPGVLSSAGKDLITESNIINTSTNN